MDDSTPDTTPDTPTRSVEDRLRQAMTAGIDHVEADAGPPVADPVDLSRRRVRHHRRRQAGVAAAAAILLVGAATGGWAIGRDGTPAEVEQVAGTTTTAAGSGTGGGHSPGIEVADDELPVVAPGGAGAPAFSGAGAVASSDTFESQPYFTPYGPWSGGIAVQPSAPLFSRELADGTVLDVRGNRYDTNVYDLPPFWDPPGWCFPSGDVYVGARLPEAVGQLGGVRYDDVAAGRVMVTTGIVGGPEGHPQWVVVAQAPEGAAEVSVAFPGGGSDEMEPVDGLAVLTAPAAEGVLPDDPFVIDGDLPSITVTATAADCSEVGRYEGDWTGYGAGAPPIQLDCNQPTQLPQPGPEQPADPAAAEAAVRSVWETAFGHPGTLPVAEQMTYLDDSTGVAAAQATVAQNYDTAQLSRIVIPVDAVVFATPEQAFIEYTVDATGASLGTFADRFAELVLIDGSWKITRASACGLAALGGGQCAPLPES